jgi:hypothetical protein
MMAVVACVGIFIISSRHFYIICCCWLPVRCAAAHHSRSSPADKKE